MPAPFWLLSEPGRRERQPLAELGKKVLKELQLMGIWSFSQMQELLSVSGKPERGHEVPRQEHPPVRGCLERGICVPLQ